jgi:putative heme-binding domain-containing protein
LDTLSAALAESDDPAFQREMLASLSAATQGTTGVKAPNGWSAAYAKLSVSPEAEIIAQADALAARFGDKTVFAAKRRILTDGFAPLAARQAALAVVAEQNNFQLAPLYHRLLAEPGLRLGAMRALAPYDVPATPPAILAVYASFDAEEKHVAVAMLSARPTFARALLAAIKSGEVGRAELDASVARQIRLHHDAELEGLLAEVWGVTRESATEASAEIERWKAALTPEKLAGANLARGHAQFVRLCSLCHVLYGEGRAVGPELTGANRGDLDYLLRNLVDPNSTIGKDYQLTTAETKDGRVIAGIVQRETTAALTLVNQTETLTLPRDQIRKIERLEVSLMPPGLLSSLPATEAADLIAYLRSTTPAP